MKTIIIGAVAATLLASPALAQSYSATYGTGNTINLPEAERSNGAIGVGVNAYNGARMPAEQTSPYAYAPRRGHVRHRHQETR